MHETALTVYGAEHGRHPSLSGRGTWSNLTSIEFTRLFQRANGGELVSYIGAAAFAASCSPQPFSGRSRSFHVGAAAFAASCSLADAIERAGSLETDEVAAALNSVSLLASTGRSVRGGEQAPSHR